MVRTESNFVAVLLDCSDVLFCRLNMAVSKRIFTCAESGIMSISQLDLSVFSKCSCREITLYTCIYYQGNNIQYALESC